MLLGIKGSNSFVFEGKNLINTYGIYFKISYGSSKNLLKTSLCDTV